MGLTPRCDTLKSSLRCCVNAQPELIKLLSMEPTQGAAMILEVGCRLQRHA